MLHLIYSLEFTNTASMIEPSYSTSERQQGRSRAVRLAYKLASMDQFHHLGGTLRARGILYAFCTSNPWASASLVTIGENIIVPEP